MHSLQSLLATAIQNTREKIPGHLEATFEQRNPGPESAGSVFVSTQNVESLLEASWSEANDPDVAGFCTGIRAEIPGYLGVVSVDLLPDDFPIRIQPAHGGKVPMEEGEYEGTPAAEIVGNLARYAKRVEYSTAIMGPASKEDNTLVLYTIFPGPAKAPNVDQIPFDLLLKEVGENTTLGNVRKYGFNLVKHCPTIG